MRFLAYDLSIELIRGLRTSLETIRRRDPALAKQGTDAVNSVALNLAESGGRAGRDRAHLVRIALGSLREVGAVLDIAAAHGWLECPPLARSATVSAAYSTASNAKLPQPGAPYERPAAPPDLSGTPRRASSAAAARRWLRNEPTRRGLFERGEGVLEVEAAAACAFSRPLRYEM